MKTIHIKDNVLIIKIPYDINLVSLIKTSFSGRSWDSTLKVWKCPVNEKNLLATYSMIENHDFTVFPEMMIELEKYKGQFEIQKIENEKKIAASKAMDANIEIPNLKGDLFPFQKAGVQFIENTNGKTLIADDCGLGKTVQAIAWALLHPNKRPILVVCPASLKLNWKREFEKWSSIKSYIVNSEDLKYQLPTTYTAYIINYDIVEKAKDQLSKMKFQIIILDESHYIKSIKAKRSKAVIELSKDIPHILALTGTPSLNSRPIEMYTTLKLLSPKNFGDYFGYASRFCGMRRTRYGLDVSGATNIQELSDKLRSTVMIRREKKDVLTELPDKTRVVVPQICDLKAYKKVENDLVNYLIESKNKSKLMAERISQVEQLAKVEYCKQEAVKAKMLLFIEWVKDFMENGEKLVIFGHHKEFLDKLMLELKEYNPVKLVGGMTGEEKQKSVDTFQNDEKCKIFIGSITAAGIGITLTKASYMIFLELMFVPGLHDQAEDRENRIGQKNACTVYYFLVENTIEFDIYELLQKKRKLFQELMQDKYSIVENTDSNILNDLINKLVSK